MFPFDHVLDARIGDLDETRGIAGVVLNETVAKIENVHRQILSVDLFIERRLLRAIWNAEDIEPMPSAALSKHLISGGICRPEEKKKARPGASAPESGL